MPLQTNLRAYLQLVQTLPLEVGGDNRSDIRWNKAIAIPTGTGASQNDQAIEQQYSIAGGATEVVNLQSIENVLNESLTLTNVKLIALRLATGGASSVSVGPHTTDGFAAWMAGTNPLAEIGPGGIHIASYPTTGWTVGATTDQIRIVNNDGSNTAVVDLLVAGVGTVT